MKIKIQEPYWGAWKRFGWAQGIWGVGIKKKVVEEAIEKGEKLELKIWNFKDTYIVSPKTVKNYAQKNRTMHLARHGTVLYIVPNLRLRKEKKDVEVNKSREPEPEKTQETLF